MKKKTLLHFVISLVALLIALGAYAWWYSYVAQTSKEVMLLKEEIAQKSETALRLRAAQAALKNLEEDERKITAHFLETENLVSFLEGIQNEASALETKLSIVSVSEGGDVQNPFIKIDMTAEGTYDAIIRTMGTIEHMPYALMLTEATITRAREIEEGGASIPTWSATLSLRVLKEVSQVQTQ